MPSPIESPRRTPPKASLLLRQTPALTVFINNIIISSQSYGSAPPFSNKNKTFIAWLFCFCSRFRRKRRQGGRSAPIRLNPPPAHKVGASRKITADIGEPVFCRFKLRMLIAFAPIRCVSHTLHARQHYYGCIL